MRDFFKSKLATGIIVAATVILAGIAIFTALRLYQLRQEPVAPTAPTEPRATAPEPIACQQLAFTLTTEEPTPTPTGEPTPTTTSAPTPTEPPVGGTDPTPTPTPTTTPTPTPTSGEIAAVSPTPGGDALPDAGVASPTIFGISLGALLLIMSLMLAL